MTHELRVQQGAATERLDVFLATGLRLTRSRAARLLQDGAVLVNGQPERASYQMRADDHVLVHPPATAAPVPAAPELPIVYEDEDILVINKPAHLAAHGGSGLASAATVADFARMHTADPDPDRPGIVHRLDRDTSGLMIIAKTLVAKNTMQEQFRAHQVRKTYTALLVGRVSPVEAVIRLPLDRDPAHPLRRAVVAGGREAITRYRTIANYPGYSLVEAKPETGRTHQLRVHFAAIGHPVAGDTSYGGPKRPLGLKRQFLHASTLEFTKPSGQALSLTCPLPPELTRVVEKLTKDV